MAFDPKGRLIVAREKEGLLRVTLPKEDQPVKVEELSAPVNFAMGLCFAFNSFYVNADGPEGTGRYRLRDLDDDGQFEQVELLMKWEGTKMHDHGPHKIRLGPDNKLYVLNGNFIEVPARTSKDSAYQNYQEDLLLPRQWDATCWAVGRLAPGACVYPNKDGENWELVCGGMRNPYGFDFNPSGELFAFDSDMERHAGTPWERPT